MISASRWADVRRLFELAVDEPVETRDTWLRERCAGDDALRRAVEAMLRVDEGASDDAGDEWLEQKVTHALCGVRIGPCRILRPLGVGGMGSVFLGEQDQPRRRVAVKILHLGITSPATVRRFEFEAEALASLRHPGIAHVYHAGVHRGKLGGGDSSESIAVPYLVMEYIEDGRPLPSYAAERRLDRRARLVLFLQVCDAVQHAHVRGVVHRDLKPENLLVDHDGAPRVIDFGIATAADHASAVEAVDAEEQVYGSGRYMSPEQREGATDVDLRTDVFALGVVLRELVGEDGCDLRWIVAAATAEDRDHRYGSAGELAAEVRRHLEHEPVLAAPPSVWYRSHRFARRHRAAAGVIALVALALIAGAGGLTAGYLEATRQRRAAEERADEVVEVVTFLENMVAQAQPWHGGGEVPVREMLRNAGEWIEHDAEMRPRVAAALHVSIGWSLRCLGELRDAEPHLTRAVELLGRPGFARPRECLVAMHRLGLTLQELGRIEDAERVLAEAAATATVTLGPRDRLTMSTTNLHAVALGRLGRTDDALTAMQRLLDASEEEYGVDAVETLGVVNNMVSVLSSASRYQLAEQYAARAAASVARSFGEEHPDTHVTQQNHAAILHLIGRDEDSERATRAVLSHRRPLLGDDHPFTILSDYWLGVAIAGQGRHAEAIAQIDPALQRARVVLGLHHAHTQQLVLALAESRLGVSDVVGSTRLLDEIEVLDPPPGERIQARVRRLRDRIAVPVEQ